MEVLNIKEKMIIGSGTHSKVYFGSQEGTCIKKNSKNKLDQNNIDYYHEINILKTLNFENIIKLISYYEDNEYIYQILEKGETDLYNKLGKVDENTSLFWIKEIAKGLNYLHTQNIMHRDIKAENIILKNNKIKIIDFGYACYFKKGEKFSAVLGTIHYVSPEMVKRSYDYRIDIWALGILYYELIKGFPPFFIEDGDFEDYQQFFRLNFNILFNYKFSKKSQKNIIEILKKFPEERATLNEIINF